MRKFALCKERAIVAGRYNDSPASAFRARIVPPACYRAEHAGRARGLGARGALPVGRGPGPAGRAARPAAAPGAASVRLPARRAGRRAGRAARAGRRGGPQGGERRARAPAAVGGEPRPAARLARTRPAGPAPSRPGPAGHLAGTGAGLGPGRRAGPAPRADLGEFAVPGASLPYLAALARFADGLAACGRVLPVLAAEGGGRADGGVRGPLASGARRRRRAARA